jgi:hypothetical protein
VQWITEDVGRIFPREEPSRAEVRLRIRALRYRREQRRRTQGPFAEDPKFAGTIVPATGSLGRHEGGTQMIRLPRIAMTAVALLIGLTAARSQTPGTISLELGARSPALHENQPNDERGGTTGSAPRQQRELSRDSPADGDTDRAPPSKLQPGELPTPQNPKTQ